MHDRIDQLEKLVTTLMSGKDSELDGPAPSTWSHLEHHSDDNAESLGTPDRVKFNGDTTSYTNSGHWTSILDGVSSMV